MKYQTLMSLVLSFLIISCSHERTLYIKTGDADGLSQGSAVVLNGVPVGKVTGLSLTEERNVIVELSIDPKPRIPADTRFKIQMADILGTKEIELLPGKDNRSLNHMDTITVMEESFLFNTDTIQSQLLNVLKDVAGAVFKDSVLIELKKLNQHLDSLSTDGANRSPQNGLHR